MAQRKFIKPPTHTYVDYTPEIKAPDDASFSVGTKQFKYFLTDAFMMISGRFQITSVGTEKSKLVISYPSDVTCAVGGYGAIGSVALNRAYEGPEFSVRSDSTKECYIQKGPGGEAIPDIGAGWIMMYAIIPR